jgi:(1->4)-alpha-D-glucan 1-alpha-D-glucosylmutase
MERYICIHGHFYQPPRENAWLEAVELQDSAYPYHDWNERITAECYAPNSVARILDAEGRIARIVNNYARISFNFGPTLLAWLADKSPDVYRAILQADRDSQQQFSGHGSALAQPYNHMILPLANRRDKYTQVAWGLRDFEQRFGRKPEGMWLPETAVDLETLDVLAEFGIRFTVLAPHQATKARKVGEEPWQDVTGGKVDPSMAYVQHLPSGRTINLFFYDGPISRALAFEQLLARGEDLLGRLLGAFSDARPWPQLVHIATDGETYGHHHPHGDMGLAFALQQIAANNNVRLTNYGEFLEKHPPTHEVQVLENTAWSCRHGIERWRSDCGCNSGRPGWKQAWRKPLREAFDWLRDTAAPLFEKQCGELVKDPWAARNEYISMILDRSPENLDRFFKEHTVRELKPEERAKLLKLLELQRHALLMYTSCGWFFDDVSGLETVQVIQYAARAVQLAQELFGEALEAHFLELLEKAKSNVAEHRDGRLMYEKLVKPSMLDWERVGAHYAVSSLFETYPPQARIFCYTADREDVQLFEAGKAKLLVGRGRITSEITHEAEVLTFGALHFGDHNVNGGVRKFQGETEYKALVQDLAGAFAKADFPDIIRLMDRGFGESTYSLGSLFRDEQRKIIRRVLQPTLAETEAVYRRLYEQHLPTMRFLAHMGVPLPRAFQTAAEFLFNTDLRWAMEDDEPNLEQIRTLFKEATGWKVTLDHPGLGYRFKKTIGRIAERFRLQPADLTVLQTFDAVIDLAQTLPFEVDLWQAQNVYAEALHNPCPQFLERASEGDAAAQTWLDHFATLGDKLGVQVSDLKKKLAAVKRNPTVREIIDDCFTQRRVPLATYRLQFNPKFTFADARALVPYLHELGITDCYASPLFQARPGSMHGYDACDYSRLNSELGSDKEFEALSAALKAKGLGLILDIVPNHMGIGHPSNIWWMDVLENGPSSIYAGYFDIDWRPANPSLENKVLLPVLGDQYGAVLESGHIRLAYEDGAFFLYCYDHKLPVAPASYRTILEQQRDSLTKALGETNPHLHELHSIVTALSYLPPRTELPPEKVVELSREKEVIKRRLAALVQASPEVKAAIDATLAIVNGKAGEPRSFDPLDQLVNAQAYRPAFWRVAAEEINYRRFFDINELAAIRVERPEVFQAVHQLVFRLLAEGKVHGLRIDHPDGLWDPTSYFRQLQENYILHRVRTRLGLKETSETLQKEVATRLLEHREKQGNGRRPWPLYVVAEKILSENEPLPPDWAVSGTTGYDFLNAVNGLFVDGRNRDAFDNIYAPFIGTRMSFVHKVKSSEKMIMLVSMASELNSLSHQLDRISERNRRYRDFTLNSLTFALREIIASLAVYRTYITGPEAVSARDRKFIEDAVEDAKLANPRTAEAIFDFIRDTLLLRNINDFHEDDRPKLIDWVMRFQQVTGPVLAKGLEDTVCYIWNRLASVNEVGSHPDQFGMPLAAFHRQNADRAEQWPESMLATSTHDTKRSEDVRARIDVLSEIPDEWKAALERWSALNAQKKTIVEKRPAPDRNDEYLLYQTLVGAWPVEPQTPDTFAQFRDRIVNYMQKATKEAKVHTSWVNPNEEYDAAVHNFVCRLLPDQADDPFVADVRKFQKRVAFFGYYDSLAQLLLKLTCPGVADIYQGTELWDFTLVDPDNRRPVDYARRRQLLAELRKRSERGVKETANLLQELVGRMDDGRIKLFLMYQTLQFRRAHRELFLAGSYQALDAAGAQSEHICAFLRQRAEQAVVVAVPRLFVGLCGGVEQLPLGKGIWKDTSIVLPPECAGRSFRNVFTQEVVRPCECEGKPALSLAALFARFPVALLERGDK